MFSLSIYRFPYPLQWVPTAVGFRAAVVTSDRSRHTERALPCHMPPRPPYRMRYSHSGSTVDPMADRTSADRTHPCAHRPRALWHATTHSRQAMERRLSARAAPYDGAAAAAAGPARAQHRSAPSHSAFCPTRPSDSRPQRSAAVYAPNISRMMRALSPMYLSTMPEETTCGGTAGGSTLTDLNRCGGMAVRLSANHSGLS